MDLWGISETHIKDAIVELARYSIGSGYSISYGGDLQYKHFVNFPSILREIIQRYSTTDFQQASRKSVSNYLAWHLNRKTPKEVKQSFSRFMNIIDTPAPKPLANDPDRRTPEENVTPVFKALSLTCMREKMNTDIDARVLLAGKIVGSSGIYPGLVEESFLALSQKKAVYLLGGFGGCTHKIIELIEKKRPKEITVDFQIKNDDNKKELFNEYSLLSSNHPEYQLPPIDYEKMIHFFEETGVEGLNNGLSIEENKILFETRNIKEMLRLLFKGLSNISKKDGQAY
jgi:hypothetical protein